MVNTDSNGVTFANSSIIVVGIKKSLHKNIIIDAISNVWWHYPIGFLNLLLPIFILGVTNKSSFLGLKIPPWS